MRDAALVVYEAEVVVKAQAGVQPVQRIRWCGRSQAMATIRHPQFCKAAASRSANSSIRNRYLAAGSWACICYSASIRCASSKSRWGSGLGARNQLQDL